MLVIETSSSEKFVIPSGTYRLNSQLNRHTFIAEVRPNSPIHQSPSQSVHEGYITFTNETKVLVHKYDLSNKSKITPQYSEYPLPNSQFETTWAQIIYSESFKYDILDHLIKIFTYDEDLLSLFGTNKCILIYGPPGTGKTSLARAVCQRLSIRIHMPFLLREIHCANIFSKFYGESMKFLNSIFENESEENIIYLVDEIESLVPSREALFGKNEPNDTLRIVNLFLTIMEKSKAIFIFTSNFIQHLDPAFLDRCDYITQMEYISHSKTYLLCKQMISQLVELGIFVPIEIKEFEDVSMIYQQSLIMKTAEHYKKKTDEEIGAVSFVNHSLNSENHSKINNAKLDDDPSFLLFKATRKMSGKSGRQIKNIFFRSLGSNNLIEVLNNLFEKINEKTNENKSNC